MKIQDYTQVGLQQPLTLMEREQSTPITYNKMIEEQVLLLKQESHHPHLLIIF